MTMASERKKKRGRKGRGIIDIRFTVDPCHVIGSIIGRHVHHCNRDKDNNYSISPSKFIAYSSCSSRFTISMPPAAIACRRGNHLRLEFEILQFSNMSDCFFQNDMLGRPGDVNTTVFQDVMEALDEFTDSVRSVFLLLVSFLSAIILLLLLLLLLATSCSWSCRCDSPVIAFSILLLLLWLFLLLFEKLVVLSSAIIGGLLVVLVLAVRGS